MDIHIHNHYHGFSEEQFSLIIKNQKKIMDATQQLNDKIDQLQAAVDDKQAQLEAANTALKTQIDVLNAAKEALTAELANSVNPDATNAAIARIDAVIADVASTPA